MSLNRICSNLLPSPFPLPPPPPKKKATQKIKKTERKKFRMGGSFLVGFFLFWGDFFQGFF